MKITVDSEQRTIRIDNEWSESKHPRDNDGKFAEKGTITIRGNELGGFNMTSAELRNAAVDYYKKHLAGTTVKHPELGDVIFSRGGYKKPIAFSADTRKLKLFPFLPEIIKRGELIETEKDRDNRNNVKAFYVLGADVKISGKQEKIRITIRRDDKGNLYYDHVVAKRTLDSSPAYNVGRDVQGLNNSIADSNLVVNIFFAGEVL